jgi:hypothetical protein
VAATSGALGMGHAGVMPGCWMPVRMPQRVPTCPTRARLASRGGCVWRVDSDAGYARVQKVGDVFFTAVCAVCPPARACTCW